MAVQGDDAVNHPSHYEWLKERCGVAAIDITRHFDFDLGNALKYILRAGRKSGGGTAEASKIEDLRKAVWYLNDEITHLIGNEKEKKK